MAPNPKLPPISAVKVLSPNCTRILGSNPGFFTLQGTNTYLVGGPQCQECILIDAGSGLESRLAYTHTLQKILKDTGRKIDRIIITHYHGDHTGGLPQVLHMLQNQIQPTTKVIVMGGGDPYAIEEILDATTLPLDRSLINLESIAEKNLEFSDGVILRVLLTPGHTDEHISFILIPDNVLLAGDVILGNKVTTVFSSLTRYIATLKRLRELVDEYDIKRIFPGHGEVIEEGPEDIDRILQYRKRRSLQIYEILVKTDGATVTELTDIIYEGHGNPMKQYAAYIVHQHVQLLIKLHLVAAMDESKFKAIGTLENAQDVLDECFK